MDLERKVFTKEIGGRELKLEVSKIAEQANSAVMATYGGTTALVAVVMGDSDTDLDYMPLTVDYEERFYAAGKILGSRFVRREGRPSEDAVLSGRLIDRTLRPLFDKRIRRSIQVVTTILSYDEENDPDFVSLIAASAALATSDIPWGGPVAGVRVTKAGDGFAINSLNSKSDNGPEKRAFEAFFAGTDARINMIELGGNEVDEKDVIESAKTAQVVIKELIDFQKEIVSKIGKPKASIELKEPSEELVKEIGSFLDGKLEEAVYAKDKTDKSDKLGELKKSLYEYLESKFGEEGLRGVEGILEKKIDDLVHKNILELGKRPDGRALDEVRDLYGEVSLLPRAHGSALFIRGGTQALSATTLASPGSEQTVETLEHSGKKRFMLHYNFPGFSVGEAKPFRGPGRRDIGHGALAEKAIKPLIPAANIFPYTIRVVSEILASNGSSSMATVSAASMSLMDAGVPISSPVAGIAMGLIDAPDGRHKILTDIQGPEDHYGDMDLKVAGTKDGVNAMQMDVKIQGITVDILEEALEAAKKARFHILDLTNSVIPEPRKELSEFAPRILSISIDPSRIGEVIGPGGKVINGIIEKTGVESIDIDDDGLVYITSGSKESGESALEEVRAIVRELEVGEVIDGEVVKLLDFGAIVDLGGGKTGLLHVSEISDKYVEDVSSVVKIGDKVRVKVIKIENGKTSLSLKRAKS